MLHLHVHLSMTEGLIIEGALKLGVSIPLYQAIRHSDFLDSDESQRPYYKCGPYPMEIQKHSHIT